MQTRKTNNEIRIAFRGAESTNMPQCEIVGHDRDHIPHNDAPGTDQCAVNHPENLKRTRDSCHPRIHADAGAPLQHRNEVRQRCEGCAESCQEADDLSEIHRSIKFKGQGGLGLANAASASANRTEVFVDDF